MQMIIRRMIVGLALAGVLLGPVQHAKGSWDVQAAAHAATRSGADLVGTLQRALDRGRQRSGAPGATAVILKDGQVVWQGASGLAEVATRTPATPSTLFVLASVSKTYVSTMVQRLIEQGKLHLDDPIAAYLPSYIPSTKQVTIRNVLGMTSGYADVEGSTQFAAWSKDPNHVWSQSALFHLIKPVVFKPGSRYDYSNINYLLLGAILAQTSGESVTSLFESLILTPLGLQHTFLDRVPAAAPLIAHGYEGTGALTDYFKGATDNHVPTDVWGPLWTDGGIAATAPDVALFFDHLFGGRVLQPATLAQMVQPGPNGSYGLGTYRYKGGRHTWQGNNGEYGGFTTEAWYDAARKLTIVVLTNRGAPSDPADAIWQNLSAAYDRATG